MATDYRFDFMEGYEAPADERCPHLLTSNCGDAWILGRFAKQSSLPVPAKQKDLVKGRGYTWKFHGLTYKVEGLSVERIG
jgi:hypothetical protein